ncbi:hypothetical protein JCM5350_008277 [Sporobolomyces pararoseus]
MSLNSSQNEQTSIEFLPHSASSTACPTPTTSSWPRSTSFQQASGLPDFSRGCQTEQLPSPPLESPSTFSQLRSSEFAFDYSSHGTSMTEQDGHQSLALQLSSFDPSTSSYPPLSAPASYASFPHSSSDLTTPPLESSSAFFPFDPSTPQSYPEPPLSSSSSPSSRPSYVRTFRLPGGPSTPPIASTSSSSNKRVLHPSPSLSAALSVLGQTPPWTQREREPQSVESPAASLFTTLEAAAETLRRSGSRQPLSPLDVDASFNPKRPKPFRSSTEPFPYSSSSASLLSNDSPPSTGTPKSPSRSKGKKRPEGHIPRAPNAWILYRSARVKELTESGQAPKLQSDLSKLVGSMWREESAEVKELYARKASVEAKLHAERNPGYSYKPTPSGLPRRKPSKKDNGKEAGRARSRTTSALQAHLSGFSLNSSSTSPQPIPSVLLPSPFNAGSPSTIDSSVASSYSYEDSPFTPSMVSYSDSTLPSTPSSSASEAWTVFQASGLPSFDYPLPNPPLSSRGGEEPCSAPARISTFPFSFSQPPPIFEPFYEDHYFPGSTELPCSSSVSSASIFPSVLAPAPPSSSTTNNEEQTPAFEDFLATLPLDQSGQLSVPVSNYSGSEFDEETAFHLQNSNSQDYSVAPLDLQQFSYP